LVKKKHNRVRCSLCNGIVGSDPNIKRIEMCAACKRGKRIKRVTTAASNYARTKKGIAFDLPERYHTCFFRSGWEMNFARWLVIKDLEFLFEKTNFSFHGYKRKPRMYVPDFVEVKSGIIWEVKGYLRPDDRQKMRRMKKQHPEDFKRLKACLSRSNKAAISFYDGMGIETVHIEDLKKEYESLLGGKESFWGK